MLSRFWYPLLFCSYLLSGCGGAGGVDGPSCLFGGEWTPDCQIVTPPPPPPNNNESPLGLWVGQLTEDNDPSVSYDFFGIIPPGRGGEFRFFSLDPRMHFVGELTVDGNQVTGSGDAWVAAGSTWTDGSVMTSVDINAELAEQQSLNGAWSTGSGDSGTMTLSYDAIYERPPNLPKTEANWFYTDGTYSITISIGDVGITVTTGSDSNGCILDGRANTWPFGVNVYSFGFDLTNCGLSDGRYDGFATIVDDVVQDDTLIVSVNNDQSAFVFVLSR